ncbi:MAG: hypothetical protein WB615_05060 [Candidatus Tumulicola sp.]
MAVAMFTGCSNNGGPQLAPTGSIQQPAVGGADATKTMVGATFQPGHLYVAQGADIASKVYRFPLQANGLPSKTPDGELSLGFRYPSGIAIGPDGDLYVSSSGTANACRNEAKCFVEVFAPGASGKATPIRVLYVPDQPQYIAVDQRGYLDVSLLRSGVGLTNVYSPNASGNDQPINQISSDGVKALAARRGIVYIQTVTQGIDGVHEHARNHQPINFADPRGETANGIATDATRLYGEYYSQPGNELFLAVAVYDLDHAGGPIRTIIGIGCKERASGGALGYGLAVYKQYLFEGCIALGGAAGGVLVYDGSKHGKQAPIMQLPGGNIGVAIGP